jgi:hypothetical protein
MESKKLILPAVMFVLGVSLLVFALFSAFQPSKTLTGKVASTISTEENVQEEGGASLPEKAAGICSNNACNPSNSRQICVGEQWVNCLNEKVCNLGECVEPVSVGPSTKKVIISEGGGGGGGGSVIVTTSVPPQPETTSSIGVVEDIGEIKAQENEKVSFTIGGAEQNIKILSISPTSIAAQLNGQGVSFGIGSEQRVDTNNDGGGDYSLVLDSINLALKKARFLVTKI